MKKLIVASLALLLTVLLLPLTVKSKKATGDLTSEPPRVSGNTDSVRADSENMQEDLQLIYRENKAENLQSEDLGATVSLLEASGVRAMSMHEYLIGVVAAEMPPSFGIEALKAQAVAARTYTLYRIHEERSANHPEADVCGNVSCCKAYLTREQLKERWGGSFDEYIKIIEAAVSETDGLCLTYDGRAIFAAFHSSSSGYTESAGNVFSRDLPYLQSVFSPESGDTVPNYSTSLSVGFDEFRSSVCQSFPGAVFSVDPSKWISDVERSFGGRIVSLKVGGTEMSGTQFRFLFGLRSAAVDIEQTADGFAFSVTGYGHGVGMSQYGANALAAAGSSFKEILSWYYTGTEIVKMSEVY